MYIVADVSVYPNLWRSYIDVSDVEGVEEQLNSVHNGNVNDELQIHAEMMQMVRSS